MFDCCCYLLRVHPNTTNGTAEQELLEIGFGVPLEELAKRSNTIRNFPFVVILCINHLISNCTVPSKLLHSKSLHLFLQKYKQI